MADRTIRTVLTLVTDQFESALQRAGRAAQGLGDASKRAGDATSSAMDRMVKSARTNSQEWRQVGGALTTVGAATTGLMGAVLATGIGYNTLRQQSTAALTSILRNSTAANIQMDKLDEFASTSPFARDVFIRAQQQMLGFGIEAQKVIPYLDAIQNAVAAAGGSNHDIAELARIFSQVSASAKITATDLREFGNRGIDAATLIGSQMGKTGAEIRESITDGSLDAQVALDALAAGMATRFEGAAEGVKNTFLGATDRVKAAFRDLSSIVAEPLVGREGGGLLTGLLNQIADLMRAVERLPDPIIQLGGALTGLGGMAALGAGGFMLLLPRLVETWDAAEKLGIALPRLNGRFKDLDLRGAARYAGMAATALVGLAAAGNALAQTVPSVDGGVQQLRRRLLDLEDAGYDVAAAFDDINKSWYSRNTLISDSQLVRDLDDFEQKLRIMTDGNVIQNAQRAIGGFIGVFESSAQGQFETRIGQYNEDLATLVQSGHIDQAAEMFNNLNMAAGGTTQAGIELINAMPDLRDALVGIANESGMATDDVSLLNIALGYIVPAAEEAAAATGGYRVAVGAMAEAQTDANNRLREWRDMVAGANDSFGSLVEGYNAAAEAADEGAVSLEAWMDQLSAQAEAVANWRENVLTATQQIKDQLPSDMQAAAHGMVDELIAAGPEGAAALALFTQASAEEKLRILEDWQGTGYTLGEQFADEVEAARQPEIGASTVPAEEALAALLGAIAAGEEDVIINGHALPAENVLETLRYKIATSEELVTIDGNEAPANDVLNALMRAIANEEEDVTINGNRIPADRVTGELLRWIEQQAADVDVGANTAQATRDVNNWRPPNKTIAMGADLSAARREIASWSPAVQVRLLGQAAVATGGYMGHFPRFADGGSPRRVSGLLEGPGTTTSDSILAALSRKEFVVNAAATDYYSPAVMYALNRRQIPKEALVQGFAGGGTPRHVTQYLPAPRAAAPQAPQVSAGPDRVDLSQRSIDQLADVILAGARDVSRSQLAGHVRSSLNGAGRGGF